MYRYQKQEIYEIKFVRPKCGWYSPQETHQNANESQDDETVHVPKL